MEKEKNEIEVAGLTIYWDSDEENKDMEVGSRQISIMQENQDSSTSIDVLVRDVDKLCKALQKAKKANQWEYVKRKKR